MEHTLRAHQLFASMSAVQADQILQWIRSEEKEVYRNSLAMLAQQRKLRPVFVQKKNVQQQFAWLKQSLSRLPAEETAVHLLQVWLLQQRSEILVAFLDVVGIEHDGKGGVDDLPEALDQEKLKTAIEKLLEDYEEEEVRIYLHLFQRQRAGGWAELDELLGTDPRLSWK